MLLLIVVLWQQLSGSIQEGLKGSFVHLQKV